MKKKEYVLCCAICNKSENFSSQEAALLDEEWGIQKDGSRNLLMCNECMEKLQEGKLNII